MAVDKKQMWLFGGLCVMFAVGIVLMLLPMFKRGGAPTSEDVGSVAVTLPDAEVKQMADSKSEAMRGAVTLDKYFDELKPEGADSEEDMSLVSTDSSSPAAAHAAAPSSPSGTAVDRVFGPAPSPSSASPEVFSPSSPISRPRGGGSSASRPRTEEERLEYDRKRAEMVRDVLSGGSSVSEDSPVTEDAPEKPVSIDLSAVGTSDGIISTLDDEPSEGVSYGDGVLKPFKCMFVRDQKLVNGQRVTLRLLEDYADGGVRIPANTHLQAICKIGDRLELQVRSLDLGGRIVPLSLEAYDTDGLQGIYCPETSASKNSRKASDDAIATAGQTFGGLVGDLANTVIRTGASIAKSATGEVSVSVVSGYEFYLVKIEKR